MAQAVYVSEGINWDALADHDSGDIVGGAGVEHLDGHFRPDAGGIAKHQSNKRAGIHF